MRKNAPERDYRRYCNALPAGPGALQPRCCFAGPGDSEPSFHLDSSAQTYSLMRLVFPPFMGLTMATECGAQQCALPPPPPSLPPSLPQTPAHPHPPSMKETELTRENRNVSPNLKKKKKKDFRAMKSCDSDKEQISLGVFASFFGDFR